MTAVFADTSAFYAFLDEGDVHHTLARKLWKSTLDSGVEIFTSNYVVLETCALVQRRQGLKIVQALLNGLLPLVNVEWVMPELHDMAIQAVLASNRKGLSVVDCTSFAMMRARGARHALAFDQHFREQGFHAPS